MKSLIRASLLVALAASLAASCSKIKPITAPGLDSGRADYSVVAALGTSISAGVQSNGLVDRHQTRTYVSMFAQQVGAMPLDLPLIDGDGIPPLLEIKRLLPPPILIAPISSTNGTPTNLDLMTAYHNMGIPGALLTDVIDTSFYQLPARNNPYFTIMQRGRGSIALQIGSQLNPAPSFLLFEFGASEVLGPATRGTAAGVPPGATFSVVLSKTLDSLRSLLPNAKMAILNVPDVTSFPFFTTLSNKVLDAAGNPVLNPNGTPRFLLGPGNVALTANDLVLLKASTLLAQGYGHPTGTVSYYSGMAVPGNGIGLADSLVLSFAETSTIQAEVRKYNGAIDDTARVHDLAVVDLNGLLRRAATSGLQIRGVTYTSEFVTGGLFSLDGVHPNDLAHALICNELISAVNAQFSSNIQPLDPTRFATFTSSRARGARGESRGAPAYLPESGVLLQATVPWPAPPAP